MQPQRLTIKGIFEGEHRYVVPMFQRPYVWSQEEQWQPLWNDLVPVAEEEGLRLAEEEAAKAAKRKPIPRDVHPHFLGAVVLEQQQNPTGDIELRLITMGVDSPEALVKACAEGGEEITQPIPQAYLFFCAQIESWLGSDPAQAESRAKALYGALCQHLWLVVIDLDPKDDAQVIFETLNARGTPLLPSDLVKNYLFQRARRENAKLDQLYKKYWSHFDQDSKYWRKKWGTGHARRPTSEWFLMHYLTAVTMADVPVTHVYAGYRKRAEAQQEATAEELLASLKKYSVIYRSFDRRKSDSRTDLFFERLDTMGFDSAYPFLMELYARFGDDETAILPVLLDIESFLVRRLVCNLNTRGYNRLFVDLLPTLDGPKSGLHGRVRDFLLKGTSESNQWPQDSVLMTAWLFTAQGKKLRKSRLRMLLEAIESALRSPKTESKEVPRKLTIEHVMPVRWEEHWSLPDVTEFEGDPAEHRNFCIQCLGNLTLLTKKLNPSISNGPWEKKRAAISEHSLLMLNKELCKREKWNEEQIQSRGADMFMLSLIIWPHPHGDFKQAKQ